MKVWLSGVEFAAGWRSVAYVRVRRAMRLVLAACASTLVLAGFSSTAGAVVVYQYDGAGRVVVRSVDNGQTVDRYAYDGQGELIAINGESVQMGPKGEFALGAHTLGADSPNGPIVQRGARTGHGMPDQLGTIRAFAGDGHGARRHASAFGATRTSQAEELGYGFTGALAARDDVMLGHRQYVSDLGSFGSRDSGAFAAAGVPLSRYAYVSGRVTTRIDPTGQFEVPVPGTGLVITNEGVPERISGRARQFAAGFKAKARQTHQGGYTRRYPNDLMDLLTAPLPDERVAGLYDLAGQASGELFSGVLDELLQPSAGIVRAGRVDPSWFRPNGRLRNLQRLFASLAAEVNPRCVIFGNCGDCSIIGALAFRHPADAVPPLPVAQGHDMRLAPDSEGFWLDGPVVQSLENLMVPGSAGLLGSLEYDGVLINGYGPTVTYNGADHSVTVLRALDGTIHTIDFQRGGVHTSDPGIINQKFSRRSVVEIVPRRRSPL